MSLDYLYVAAIIALIWGGVWASCLQFTGWGRFLALRRTWVTVIVGIGGDVIILYFILPMDEWFKVFAVITASSILIIVRSLYNEHKDLLERIDEQRQIIEHRD